MNEKKQNKTNGKIYQRNFFDVYSEAIAPKLRQIDICVKEGEFPFSLSKTSNILELSNDEVYSIMRKYDIEILDYCSFFTIMINGSSDICRLFQREIQSGSPSIYTADKIAYIYDLNKEAVNAAYRILDTDEVTELCLPELFALIPAGIE